MPALEIYEKNDKYVVRAELPGMKQDEIDVSILGDTLTIKGERKAESEVKDDDYHRCELCYGKFTRSVTLPTAAQAAKVDATYRDGILEINLPKAAATKPKKVGGKVTEATTKAARQRGRPRKNKTKTEAKLKADNK